MVSLIFRTVSYFFGPELTVLMIVVGALAVVLR